MAESTDHTQHTSSEPLDRLVDFAEHLDLGIWKYNLVSRELEWDTSVYGRYAVDRNTFPTPFDFWSRCLTEESLRLAAEKMALAHSGQKHYNATYELELPSGERRHVWARARLIADENGQPAYLHGINVDVTNQVAIERERKQLLARLQEAQAIAKIGSWTFDPKTKNLVWSHELYKIYGISEPQTADTLYSLYRTRIHPDDVAIVDNALAQAFESGHGYVIHYRLVHPDGSIRHIEGVGRVALDADGKVSEFGGTCRDQTLEVEARNLLENERIMATRNAHLAALGELSAGVAHEINNPLTIIEGHLHVLSNLTGLPPMASASVRSIDGAWRRISKIVSGLKKFARSDEGSVFEKHVLGDIVSESLTLVEMKAKRHDARLIKEIAFGVEIFCDRIHIEQVIINLVNNAIDAVKTKAERWIKVSLSIEGGYAVLRVSDSGAGVEAQNLDKLFAPFYTTKVIGEGTGLGLSISKGIIEEHGGTIVFVKDSPHTCFEVRLKRAEGWADA